MLRIASDSYRGEFEPGAGLVSDNDLAGWLRANASSDNHETGSASMMPKALGGVVDTKLKVYGTENVRVVGAPWSILIVKRYTSFNPIPAPLLTDASIIPFPVSAHIVS